MASRLEFLRDLRKLTQAELAARAHTTPSQIGKLERGERRLTADWQQRLARAMDCAVSDLIEPPDAPEGDALSVPIEWTVAAAFAGEAQPSEPFARVPALPGLARARECAAARVADDSCDRLYPAGSTLIARRAAYVRQWRVGDKVVLRRRGPDEILVGLLDRSSTGDIVVHLRSSSRDVPAAIVIQPAIARDPLAKFGVADRFAPAIEAAGGRDIALEPRAEDPAELLGVVVMAITPE